MTDLSPAAMNADEFLVWAEGRRDRYELVDGRPHAMAPERAGHARAKVRVHRALDRAIGESGLPCEAMPDGMTVRVDSGTAFEPDASVYCGAKIAEAAIEVPSPVIVVEVLSPSTGFIDRHHKLTRYFSIPSVRHYLIVDIDRPTVIHHARNGEVIVTRLLVRGPIRLDPPGLYLTVEELLDGH